MRYYGLIELLGPLKMFIKSDSTVITNYVLVNVFTSLNVAILSKEKKFPRKL